MAYSKNTWTNNETELNAQNMNHIEDGIENTQNVKLLAINTQAPSQCATGDKYYNKTTKKIYTAIATNTWGETGENPIPDIIYIVFSEKGTYSYDGDTLVSVGGGSGAYIGTTEPPEDDNSNLWVNPEEVVIRQDNIVKTEYNESDDNTYSTNYINGTILYENSTGSKENITLSDSVANYRYIELYYYYNHWNGKIYGSKKIDNPNLKTISIGNELQYMDANNMYWSWGRKTFNGNTLTHNEGGSGTSQTNGSNNTETDNLIYIYKVIGYK